jgi:hypothetical protein
LYTNCPKPCIAQGIYELIGELEELGVDEEEVLEDLENEDA